MTGARDSVDAAGYNQAAEQSQVGEVQEPQVEEIDVESDLQDDWDIDAFSDECLEELELSEYPGEWMREASVDVVVMSRLLCGKGSNVQRARTGRREKLHHNVKAPGAQDGTCGELRNINQQQLKTRGQDFETDSTPFTITTKGFL